MTTTVPTTTWVDQALCREADPDAWFPDVGGSTRAVVAVCGRCPVTAQCLTHALDTHETRGVWGGLTPHQRRDLPATTQQEEEAS